MESRGVCFWVCRAPKGEKILNSRFRVRTFDYVYTSSICESRSPSAVDCFLFISFASQFLGGLSCRPIRIPFDGGALGEGTAPGACTRGGNCSPDTRRL